MTNLVTNTLVIHDPQGGIAQLLEHWKSLPKNENKDAESFEAFLSFDHHLPRPQGLLEHQQVSWKEQHWGSKWDAFSVYKTHEDANTLRLRFDTANDGVFAVVQAMSAANPQMVMAYCYDDEDNDTRAAYILRNGEGETVVDQESKWVTYKTVKSLLNEGDPKDGLDELCSDYLGQDLERLTSGATPAA